MSTWQNICNWPVAEVHALLTESYMTSERTIDLATMNTRHGYHLIYVKGIPYVNMVNPLYKQFMSAEKHAER